MTEETQIKVEKAVTPEVINIKGDCLSWNLGDKPTDGRKYTLWQTSYGKFRRAVKPYFFDAIQNTGEQRAAKKARIKHLKTAIQHGQYSVTSFYASVRNSAITQDKNRVNIEVDTSKPLALTDGNHRREALELLRAQGGPTQKKIDNLPITCIINLDEDKTKMDFLNLQDVCSVDSGQILTMKIKQGLVKTGQLQFYNMALEMAQLLHNASNSHLYRMIRFDTLGEASLKFKSIAQAGKSDLSTSLFGTALIVNDAGKDAEWGANMILFAYEMLENDAPELLEKGNILAPLPDGTTAGSTMIIGLANMLAYRMRLLNRDLPTPSDAKIFINACHNVFDGEEVAGSFASGRKRDYMQAFAENLFRDIVEDEESLVGSHFGIPISLMLILGTSTFNVEPLPKQPSKRGRPKLTLQDLNNKEIVVTEELPDGTIIEDKEESDTEPAFNEPDMNSHTSQSEIDDNEDKLEQFVEDENPFN